MSQTVIRADLVDIRERLIAIIIIIIIIINIRPNSRMSQTVIHADLVDIRERLIVRDEHLSELSALLRVDTHDAT